MLNMEHIYSKYQIFLYLFIYASTSKYKFTFNGSFYLDTFFYPIFLSTKEEFDVLKNYFMLIFDGFSTHPGQGIH